MKAGKKLTVLGGVPINLDAYLASLSGGFRFNFRKTDRFYQESTGPTLADDVGESIGLALDQRSWGGLPYASYAASLTELVTNPTFDVDITGWSGSGATVSADTGTLRAVGAGGGSGMYSTGFSVTSGLTYRFAIRIKGDSTYAALTTGLRRTSALGIYISSSATLSVTTSYTDIILETVATSTVADACFFIRFSGTEAINLDSVSVKLLPGSHATQSGATLKPTRQTAGSKFDGTDDNLLSTYLASAGSNFLMARTTVPSSLAATQLIAGASGASANRIFIGVNTSGFACAGIGSDNTGVIVGTTDLRNQEADIGITCNGTTVRLIVNGAVEYEAAQNSTPTTTIPFRLGVHNNNGSPAANYYAGYIKECLAGTDYLTLAKFNDIRRALDRAA